MKAAAEAAAQATTMPHQTRAGLIKAGQAATALSQAQGIAGQQQQQPDAGLLYEQEAQMQSPLDAAGIARLPLCMMLHSCACFAYRCSMGKELLPYRLCRCMHCADLRPFSRGSARVWAACLLPMISS